MHTVELLFSAARQAALSDVEEVEVEFDPRLHYPTRILTAQWRDVVDDEVEWLAQLQVLRR